MSIERRLQCPSCAREIRITEAELADKRGFCAVCDARFDILPDMLIGEGVMRALTVPRVALSLEKAPDRRFSRVVSGSTTELVARPQRSQAVFLVPFTLIWCAFLVFWYRGALGRGDLFAMLFPLIHVAVGVGMIGASLWHLAGKEQLLVGAEGLTYRRGVGPLRQQLRLPAARHLSVSVEERRRVLRSKGSSPSETVVRVHGDDGELVLGRYLDLELGHAEWLARAVRKALADAQGEA